MKRYKIAHSQTIKGLGERVEHYLNCGWELHGSIVSHDKSIMQVLVKTEKQKEFISEVNNEIQL